MSVKQRAFVAGVLGASVFWAYCVLAWTRTDGWVWFYLTLAFVFALIFLWLVTQPEEPK